MIKVRLGRFVVPFAEIHIIIYNDGTFCEIRDFNPLKEIIYKL